MTRLTLLLIFIVSFTFTFAQEIALTNAFEKNSDFRKGDKFLYSGHYKDAIVEYENLAQKYEEDANLNLKLGFCYLNAGLDNDKAIFHLEKALAEVPTQSTTNLEPFLYLAEAYHKNYQFDEALSILRDVKTQVRNDLDLYAKVYSLEQYCINAANLIKKPVPITVINMGKGINSEHSDHSPIVSADEQTLIFTSTRQGTSTKLQENGEFFEDIFISYLKECQWTNPEIISKKVNSKGHEAACSLSANGNFLFVFRNGNLYLSEKENEGWSELRKIRRPINQLLSKETHAVMSPDDKYMIFTSERKDGFGGLDLYIAYRDEFGKYKRVENMGKTLNTVYDEETPFITHDGKTLYFSSKGHSSMGGFDIFVSHLVNGRWTSPQNIGYPINTTGDDVFYMPAADGKRAYYSSKQNVGSGKTDLFIIWFNEKNNLPLVSARLSDGENPIDARITLTNLRTMDKENELVAGEEGAFSYLVTPCAEHNLMIESKDKYFRFENFSTESGNDRKHDTTYLMPSVFDKHAKQTYLANVQRQTLSCNNSTNMLITALTKFLQEYDNLLVDISFSKDTYGNPEIRSYEESFRNILIEKGISPDRINTQLYVNEVKEGYISFTVHDSEYSVLSVQNTENEMLAENELSNDGEVAGISKEFDKKFVGLYQVKNITFKKNKYSTTEYDQSFDLLAAYLKANPSASIELTGFTDTQGSTDYNYQLSKKRANFVLEQLTKKGVSASQIKIKALGETKQIANNFTETGDLNLDALKYNRRVEINILTGGKDVLVIENIDVPANLMTEKKDSELPDGQFFSIILTSSETPLNLYNFIGLRNVAQMQSSKEGKYIYYYGKFYSRADAELILNQMKEAGYPDASIFIPNF